jgi:hypothetical protein
MMGVVIEAAIVSGSGMARPCHFGEESGRG